MGRRSVSLVLVGLLHWGRAPGPLGVEGGVARVVGGGPLILGVVLLKLHCGLGVNSLVFTFPFVRVSV